MDFNILHLSDLHIKDSNILQTNLTKLLADIKDQVINIYKIIVVITGDIVDKGTYNENSIKNVLEFFKQLKLILDDKFSSIIIVPGNHDRYQCVSSNIIIEKIREQSDLLSSMTQEDWNYHLLSYQKFFKLEDEIYKIFYPSETTIPYSHCQTYGVEKYINNESVIIFIKVDTSWCSLGGAKDKRKLRISPLQLEYLKNEYQKAKNESTGKQILTIALCHHPINWLIEEDENLLYSYFINEDYLNVDVILCGHVHDIEINNIYNSFRQITTLLTGIGWKEDTPSEKRNGHRYSIYIFNLRRNSCEAIVRKTDLSGTFDIDRDFLPDKISKDMGKLSIPIILRNNYPYIEIPVYNPDSIKRIPLFIDKSILTNIQKYSWKLSILMSCMKEDLIIYKHTALDDFTYTRNKQKIQKEILRSYFENGHDNADVKKILSSSNNKKYISTKFITYLCEICNHFIDLFKNDFKPNEDIRIFFRYYNIDDTSSKKYIQICQQSKGNIEGTTTNSSARDVDFDSLIEKAYLLKVPLVFSSNLWYNNLELQRWNNFITIVPIFEEYEYTTKETKLPIITCAISIKSSSDDPFLDILNYINIQEILNNIIELYLKTFQINIYECAKYYFSKSEENSR